jgi:hypothetical protein
MYTLLGIGLLILAVCYWTVGPGRGMKPVTRKRSTRGLTWLLGGKPEVVPRKKKG